MHLTQQTDYALRVLIYIADRDKSGNLSNIATIAQTYRISKSHLMKVVTALVKGGFLVSIRGKGGGISLAKSPSQINLGQVVRHMEPLAFVECMGPNNNCLITPDCRLIPVLDKALSAFLTYLDNYTLADILIEHKETQHPMNQQQLIYWEKLYSL